MPSRGSEEVLEKKIVNFPRILGENMHFRLNVDRIAISEKNEGVTNFLGRCPLGYLLQTNIWSRKTFTPNIRVPRPGRDGHRLEIKSPSICVQEGLIEGVKIEVKKWIRNVTKLVIGL